MLQMDESSGIRRASFGAACCNTALVTAGWLLSQRWTSTPPSAAGRRAPAFKTRGRRQAAILQQAMAALGYVVRASRSRTSLLYLSLIMQPAARPAVCEDGAFATNHKPLHHLHLQRLVRCSRLEASQNS